MKFYLNSFFENPGSENYLKPNKNCNLTSWVSGCEPGWACSVNSNQQVNLNDAKVIPARTLNCQACCEGFFCPDGITCMIPCPLGSYCPLAKLNKTTGVCEPYLYQLPPGQPNHTCGGANIWADVGSSSELFCSAGSFCPTTTRRNTCSSGNYCRMGSTSEKSCFKLSSCNPNSAKQNMQAYGIMLLAALSTLLLIIYNCSDQVLTTRERRLAKSREAAARSARETATARQKWKTAKDAAKKHASGLQAHLSRTFSRKKDFTHPEKLKILDQVKSDDDPIQHPSTSGSVAFLSSRVTSVEKKTEPSDLLRIMQEIEDDPDGCQGFNVGTGDKNMNIPVPKGKQTHTQIFSYAYSQLEKEKAQQEDNEKLTFSGIVKLATNAEIRKRPLLEISFKNLTLTLKAKNKHLLRCVTGEIKPGRITAVMGPSGAGKTTFLSAVAGKAIGCKMTGLILINGKNESIHSYKKIVGFVPQDDVVHGNLTVEENLWFSAKCSVFTCFEDREWSMDELRSFWSPNRKGKFSVSSFYEANTMQQRPKFPWKNIWRSKAPTKAAFFVWTAVLGKILTTDNLRRRGLIIVDWCCLCRNNGETVDHLLLHCKFASEIWNLFFNRMGIVWVMPCRAVELLASWRGITGTPQIASLWRMASICICWCIWNERNERLFEDRERSSEEFWCFLWKTFFLWAIALDFNGLSCHDFLASVSSS
ncbi:hypothetical protein I3760_01G267900 [Carya illinoinensis]|nr:hypothetical protein I3760_01G267900 [Carya illinoinensis]